MLNEQLKDEKPLEESGMMKTATVVLALNDGHSIVKSGVTPAEIEVLIALHAVNAKGVPIRGLEETTPIPQSDSREVSRLLGMYGSRAVRSVFGPNAALPTTFRDAIATAIAWANEHGEVESSPLVGRAPNPSELAAFK